MRHLTLTLLALVSFTACNAGTPLQPRQALTAQAFLPHDPGTPANPCSQFGTQAFLPHDPSYPTNPHYPTPYPTSNPCPCQHGFQTHAILPPDLNPHNPANCHG